MKIAVDKLLTDLSLIERTARNARELAAMGLNFGAQAARPQVVLAGRIGLNGHATPDFRAESEGAMKAAFAELQAMFTFVDRLRGSGDGGDTGSSEAAD